MKRLFLSLSVALLAMSFSNCQYDHSDLWDAVEDVTNRVTVLENAVRNANQNIDAMQALIAASPILFLGSLVINAASMP